MTGDHVRSSTLYITIVISASVIAVLFAGFGVLMIYMGATGSSSILLFGQSITSESVGAVSIFLASLVVILLIRRTLASHDTILGPLVKIKVDENEKSEEAKALTSLFDALKTSSDIVSDKYVPNLIGELDHYRTHKTDPAAALQAFRHSLADAVNELAGTVESFNNSEDSEPERVSPLKVFGLGGHILLNSLREVQEEIEYGLRIGREPSEVLLLARDRLVKLRK